MDGGVFSNGVMFDFEARQIREDTGRLHAECIDEGAADEASFGARPAPADACLDWRREAESFRRSGQGERPDFSRFFANEWKGAKVAARQLKFCPGRDCGQHLPIHMFASNAGAPDRLDTFCLNCNASKEATRTDKYELFSRSYRLNAPQKDTEKIREQAIWREVKKRFDRAAQDAAVRYGVRVPLDPLDASRRLFQGGKWICNVTGQVLSFECFLEHHALTYEVRNGADGRRVVDMVVSQCRRGRPPPGFEPLTRD